MRRITGTYAGTDYELIEHVDGQVECPPAVHAVLAAADGTLPTGETLLRQCHVLFGDTLRVEEGE
jgi:hypothetical protein